MKTEPAVKLAIAGDGSAIAVLEGARIALVELDRALVPEQAGELALDARADGCDLAWVGAGAAPQRLLTVTRHGLSCTARLVETRGTLRVAAEIRLDQAMRVHAAVGAYALATSGQGTVVLQAGEAGVRPYQFPGRVMPSAIGAMGSQFLVGLPTQIEEWDPATRQPKRRLRLPRPATINAVGGNERSVWLTTAQEPSRIDVIALVNRGQPRMHELPRAAGPIVAAASHPRSDHVVVICEKGGVFVVDLDGRAPLREVDIAPLERADAVGIVVGAGAVGVVVAQAGQPIAIVPIGDARRPAAARVEEPARAAVRPPDDDDDDDDDYEPLEDGGDANNLPVSSFIPASLGGEEPDVAEPDVDAELVRARDAAADGPAPVATKPTFARPAFARPAFAKPAAAPRPEATDAPATPPSSMLGLADNTPMLPRRPAPPLGLRSTPAAPPTSPTPQSPISPPIPAPPVSPPTSPPPISPPPTSPAISPPPSVESAEPPVAKSASPIAVLARHKKPASGVPAPLPDTPSTPTASGRARRLDWRDELVDWMRADVAGDVPIPARVVETAHRLEVAEAHVPILVACYAAHLCGEVGAAPSAIAALADWDEALCRGALARAGIVHAVRTRVALAPPIERALDELPPLTGFIIGMPSTSEVIALRGPAVVVAQHPYEELASTAARLVGSGAARALFIPHLRDLTEADVAAVAFEARIYGAIALVRRAGLSAQPRVPLIVVSPDEDDAAGTQLPPL